MSIEWEERELLRRAVEALESISVSLERMEEMGRKSSKMQQMEGRTRAMREKFNGAKS